MGLRREHDTHHAHPAPILAEERTCTQDADPSLTWNCTSWQDVADQKEIVTPSGLRIVDVRKGGGASPRKSYLLILHLK